MSNIDIDESRELDYAAAPKTPSALPRRKSGGLQGGATRRTSSGGLPGEGMGSMSMKAPGRPRKLSGVGETY